VASPATSPNPEEIAAIGAEREDVVCVTAAKGGCLVLRHPHALGQLDLRAVLESQIRVLAV
jgi:hypothetical protein